MQWLEASQASFPCLVFFLPLLSLSHSPPFNLVHLQRTIRNFIFSYFLPEMKEKVFSLYFLLAFTPLSSETRVLSLLSALGSTSQAEHWNHFLFYRKPSTLIASDWENFVQLNSLPKYWSFNISLPLYFTLRFKSSHSMIFLISLISPITSSFKFGPFWPGQRYSSYNCLSLVLWLSPLLLTVWPVF